MKYGAMREEIDALVRNKTWTLVPPSANQNVIGLSRVKLKSDGSLDRFKGRLVCQRFSSTCFTYTFSPVVIFFV